MASPVIQRPVRQEQLGPWILGAAIAHALALLIGIVVIVEFQKMQLRQNMQAVSEKMQQSAQARAIEPKTRVTPRSVEKAPAADFDRAVDKTLRSKIDRASAE
jgi:uncharacterized protein HemX